MFIWCDHSFSYYNLRINLTLEKKTSYTEVPSTKLCTLDMTLLGCDKFLVITFKWRLKQEAFLLLKNQEVNSILLMILNTRTGITELYTDENYIGLGVMLLQAKKEGDPLYLVY